MTTLNTIIEEEKKKFEESFDWIEEYISDKPEYDHFEDMKSFLTTAMQRVYEVVSEEKWEELNKYTIREKQENMTDWIDWDDVCKVFGKKTALEKRIKEKQEELDELLSTLNNKT